MPATISALQEILRWSQSEDRPDWQRDALRRIILGKITPTDIDELECMCRAKHAALEPSETIPKVNPLDSTYLATDLENETSISLISLGELQNCNRLPSNQTLNFGASPGLAIIYGDNGAGKSGYARVIKKACRARGQTEPIEPNVYTQTPVGNAAAKFIIRKNKNLEECIEWQDGISTDSHLRQVFVFDSDSAKHYISKDSGATFTPFGLDILAKLANEVCTPIELKLNERLAKIKTTINDIKQTWRYQSETSIGKLLNNISDKSNISDINDKAIWNDQHARRLLELDQALALDPLIKSQQSLAAADRILNFRRVALEVQNRLRPYTVNHLHKKIKNLEDEIKTTETLAQEKFTGLLPGTGGNMWQTLWNAARAFSQNFAYPNENFPVIDDNAHCVLCQSDLDQIAKQRLKQFDEFTNNVASQLADQNKKIIKELKEIYAKNQKLTPEIIKIEADLVLDEPEKIALKVATKKIDMRLSTLYEALENGIWDNISEFILLPNKLFRKIEKELRKQAEREKSAANPEERKKLEIEHQELTDQKWLANNRIAILNQIERYKVVARLEKCIQETKTNAITKKNKELAQRYITDIFCTKFATEAEKLGLKTLKVKLHVEDGRKGVTQFGVRLQDAEKAEIVKVASEGEKRCIALALFLAELSLASHSSTLVFDDPVSSLDHLHKEKIAKRLAQESLNRQVIVFTHDTVLLQELETATENESTELSTMRLEWNTGAPGYPIEGLPWNSQKAADRLHQIEMERKTLESDWNPIPNEENKEKMEKLYSQLRATLERIVECHIFADTIRRFRKDIKFGNLKKIINLSPAEVNELNRMYDRCCSITEAHDKAQAHNATIPDPTELAKDIKSIRALLEKIKKEAPTTNATKQKVPA